MYKDQNCIVQLRAKKKKKNFRHYKLNQNFPERNIIYLICSKMVKGLFTFHWQFFCNKMKKKQKTTQGHQVTHIPTSENLPLA